MFLVSSCSCLCPVNWSHALSRKRRCSWSSADRRYTWLQVHAGAQDNGSSDGHQSNMFPAYPGSVWSSGETSMSSSSTMVPSSSSWWTPPSATLPLQWCHNDHGDVSNHQPHGCSPNRLFRRKSKKTSNLRVTGLCAGNSPGPVNSPHKWTLTRNRFPFDDVIVTSVIIPASGTALPI